MRQAVRDHAESRFQPGQQDRLLADRAAGLRRPHAAVQSRLPRWREHPAVAVPRRGQVGRRATRRRGGRSCRTTRCPRSWAGSATGRARPRATGRRSTPPSASTRWSGSSATRPSARTGASRAPRPDTGKRVLIVGAGPSGLSAAYHLRLLGHQVTLRDSAVWAGGMMRFGIPAYRLPRDVLDAEVGRILAMGVTWEGGRQVTDIEAAMADGGFDAAFLAVGAQKGKRAYIPAGDSARILDAVTLLHSMEGAEPPQLGRRVAIYGGGNTAMDAARTARRLGATDAVVVYRRTRDKMPAHDDRGRGGHRRRRADDVAVHHRQGRRGQARSSRRWRWTTPASRSRPASSPSLRPTPWCSRSARRPSCPCSTACPA